MEGWATVKRAAKHADVSERTMREWLKSGLKYSRLSKKTIRIKYSDLDEYLKIHENDEHVVNTTLEEICRNLNLS